jgi:hypothetical protein
MFKATIALIKKTNPSTATLLPDLQYESFLTTGKPVSKNAIEKIDNSNGEYDG